MRVVRDEFLGEVDDFCQCCTRVRTQLTVHPVYAALCVKTKRCVPVFRKVYTWIGKYWVSSADHVPKTLTMPIRTTVGNSFIPQAVTDDLSIRQIKFGKRRPTVFLTECQFLREDP